MPDVAAALHSWIAAKIEMSGAVERDRRRDVRQLDLAADDRNADDAERRDDALVRDRDELVAGREALGRVHDRRDEDLAGLRALRAQDLLVLEGAELERAIVAGDVVVRQPTSESTYLTGSLGGSFIE
jgi:hypothetical protein